MANPPGQRRRAVAPRAIAQKLVDDSEGDRGTLIDSVAGVIEAARCTALKQSAQQGGMLAYAERELDRIALVVLPAVLARNTSADWCVGEAYRIAELMLAARCERQEKEAKAAP